MDALTAVQKDSSARLRITGLMMLPRLTSWRRASSYEVIRDTLELQEEGGGAQVQVVPLPQGDPLFSPVGGWVDFELPLELVPEVVALDLESLDACLGFVCRFGIMGSRHEWFGQFLVPGLTPGIRPLGPGPLPQVPGALEFVSEFVQAAASIRALVACLQALDRERFSPMDLNRGWPQACVWEVPRSRGEARRLVVEAINSGLSTMRLCVAAVAGTLLAEPSALLLRDLELAPALAAPATLYGVCILELASARLEGRGYRACANERCQRLFTLQEGRSRTGMHRPDVARYCSKSCASKRAMREYRKRRALERARS